ncbi:MAG: S-layer homology domain-containing protein [Oscillospiraceae bacterium]|nr:S-layer homology domain-containing protein [Oscillospiraceae bacterium]
MKRILSFLLAISLISALPISAGAASAGDQALLAVRAAGIITGDEKGNLNLNNPVTRAEFAKMMVSASAFKNSAAAGLSSFSDVRQTHWAAGYIKTAVSAGWFAGYADGTFRPSDNIKLEEAATALLRMLGYTDSADFGGSYPEPQLSRYRSAGLSEGIGLGRGGTVTRADCVKLFYNLLRADTKSGQAYGLSVGIVLDTAGNVDYTALVSSDRKGPFTADRSWASRLPFKASGAEYFLNGKPASASDMQTYDVFYYNENIQTVWICRNNVTGVYSAAYPSTAAPSSVVVSGITYAITTSSAAFEMSDSGKFHPGDDVTLLLGLDGGVVAAIESSLINMSLLGIVQQGAGISPYSDSFGSTVSSSTVTFTATDGNTYTYPINNNSYKPGDLILLQITNGTITTRSPGKRALTAVVNSAGTSAGDHKFADNIRILDASGENVAMIQPRRLSGMKLNAVNVMYYIADSEGRISDLVLKDATGDALTYGILTSVRETNAEMSVSGSYEYIIAGTPGAYSSGNSAFGVNIGPAAFGLSPDGRTINSLSNLKSTELTFISGISAKNGSKEYGTAENVSVYIYRDRNYSPANITAVSDASAYNLRGYYDKDFDDGGQVRIIVATAKTS